MFLVFNFYYGVQKNGNVSPSADPHGELSQKNHFKVTHSIQETSTLFSISEEEVF